MKKSEQTELQTYLSDKLKILRKSSKYTQENIAQILNLSRVNYVNMEKGHVSVKYEYIYLLCGLYGVTPDDFFPEIKPIQPIKKVHTKRIVKQKVITSYKPINN